MASALQLTDSYEDNVRCMDESFSVDDNFDLIKKVLRVGSDELTLYYIDGFVKDGSMTKIFIYLLGLKGLENKNATDFMKWHMPYVEAEVTSDGEAITRSLLSGATIMLGSTFGGEVMIIDARTYPLATRLNPRATLLCVGRAMALWRL